MIATKVGILKCRIIQVDGSGVDVNLHKLKYVPELWIKLFSINEALKRDIHLTVKNYLFAYLRELFL
jgi:hypothetical protein